MSKEIEKLYGGLYLYKRIILIILLIPLILLYFLTEIRLIYLLMIYIIILIIFYFLILRKSLYITLKIIQGDLSKNHFSFIKFKKLLSSRVLYLLSATRDNYERTQLMDLYTFVTFYIARLKFKNDLEKERFKSFIKIIIRDKKNVGYEIHKAIINFHTSLLRSDNEYKRLNKLIINKFLKENEVNIFIVLDCLRNVHNIPQIKDWIIKKLKFIIQNPPLFYFILFIIFLILYVILSIIFENMEIRGIVSFIKNVIGNLIQGGNLETGSKV